VASIVNRLRSPAEWQPDIDRSVAEYDEWYLAESPRMFAQERRRATVEVEEAMHATDDLRRFDADTLLDRPRALFVARMCFAPDGERQGRRS
jgi:hypothetical protein